MDLEYGHSGTKNLCPDFNVFMYSILLNFVPYYNLFFKV